MDNFIDNNEAKVSMYMYLVYVLKLILIYFSYRIVLQSS